MQPPPPERLPRSCTANGECDCSNGVLMLLSIQDRQVCLQDPLQVILAKADLCYLDIISGISSQTHMQGCQLSPADVNQS